MDLAVAGVLIGLVGLTFSLISLWQSHRASEKANKIAREQAEVAKRAFEADHFPVLELAWGTGVDPLPDPPVSVFRLPVRNVGHVAVVVGSVGLVFWSGDMFRAMSYARETGSRLYPFPTLPHELLPRRQLVINMEMMDMMKFFEENCPEGYSEVSMYVEDLIGQRFETDRMTVSSFAEKLRVEEAGARLSVDDPVVREIRDSVRETLRRLEARRRETVADGGTGKLVVDE